MGNYYAYRLIEVLYMKEFYAYYLKEHSNRTCRRLHYMGILGALLVNRNYLYTTDRHYLFTHHLRLFACLDWTFLFREEQTRHF